MHLPVLLNELLNIVQPQPGMVVIDATYGGGGHAAAIARLVGEQGKVIGIDQDPQVAKSQPAEPNISLVQANFADIGQIAQEWNLDQLDLIIADLGFSSIQLDDPKRGFSFQTEGPLDMRLNQAQGRTAAELIKQAEAAELERMLRTYAELVPKLARQLTKLIVQARAQAAITTTEQLAAIARQIFAKYPFAKKENKYLAQVFQGFRLAVNQELEALNKFLPQALALLKPGGKLAVISFHSLEDRLVKRFFQQESRDCLCPPNYPVCRCGHQAQLQVLTKKAIQPTAAEIMQNSRARSARLRVAKKR